MLTAISLLSESIVSVPCWQAACQRKSVLASVGGRNAGDLAESLIKRDCRHKDASQVVPGFGGVLDVVDAVIFARPVSYWWDWFLGENMTEAKTLSITLDSTDEALQLFGSRDQHLRLCRRLGCLIARGDTLQIEGAEIRSIARSSLSAASKNASHCGKSHRRRRPHRPRRDPTFRRARRAAEFDRRWMAAALFARTDGQARYVRAMQDNDLVFALARPERENLPCRGDGGQSLAAGTVSASCSYVPPSGRRTSRFPAR